MNGYGIRTFKMKFLQVCDDPRWDAEKVAKELEGDAYLTAPTIMQVTTHLLVWQALKAIGRAVHPKSELAWTRAS